MDAVKLLPIEGCSCTEVWRGVNLPPNEIRKKGEWVCNRDGCAKKHPVDEGYEEAGEKQLQRSVFQDTLVALPKDAQGRKDTPIASGVLDYFPAALAEVARLSVAANEQHNPGQPLHWSRGKSTDHADCIVRHLIQRGTMDTDGIRHTAKVAWRALALLQEEIEREAGFVPGES